MNAVDQQILDALALLLTPSATGAARVDVERDDTETPYEVPELPAINLLAVEDVIYSPTKIGLAVGHPVLQVHRLAIVVQILYRGANSARNARQIGVAVERLVAGNPTLGGLCSQGLLPDGRQWLRDDAAESPLTRQNTRFVGEFCTYSNDPTLSI